MQNTNAGNNKAVNIGIINIIAKDMEMKTIVNTIAFTISITTWNQS